LSRREGSSPTTLSSGQGREKKVKKEKKKKGPKKVRGKTQNFNLNGKGGKRKETPTRVCHWQ